MSTVYEVWANDGLDDKCECTVFVPTKKQGQAMIRGLRKDYPGTPVRLQRVTLSMRVNAMAACLLLNREGFATESVELPTLNRTRSRKANASK